MTKSEIDLIRRAIELLRQLVQDDKGRVSNPAPRGCPVTRFAEEYLAHDSAADVSCEELWRFFHEIADAGELPPMRKASFLRQLTSVLEAVFNVRKCHNVMRAGRRVRGFRGIDVRLDDSPPVVLGRQPEPA